MKTHVRGRGLGELRLHPLLLLLGLAFIGGAVGMLRQQQALQRADVRDIAGLRAELDSVRALAARTLPGPDSARLASNVAERTYMLQRREFHVPSRQESIDGWWRLTGIGSVMSLVGSLLVVLAAFAWFQRR